MRLILACIVIISFCLYSCEKTTLEEDPKLPTNVSYSTQVLPLFHNCYGCHNPGNPPDLSESKAYRSLIDGGYINTKSPMDSKLMIKLYGGDHDYISRDQKKIILGWITEGAKNN